MYALNPPLPPISGRPRHIAAARLVYTNNRAFSANKKKKAPVDLSKVAATTTVLRRVAWGQGAPPTFSPRYRDCENGTMHLLETILVQTRYSTSTYIFEQLCAQFYIRFIIRGRRGEREILSPLSLFPSLRKDPLPYFHWRDLKGCSSGRKAR